VRWLADALLAGHLEPWPWAAEWALRRDRAAVARLRVALDGMRLRSPLVWVLLDSGGWYSYARDGMAQSWPPTTDAVSVTPAGEVARLGWSRRAGSPEVLVSPRRLAVRRDREERELPLPAGPAALRLEIGAPPANP
jgi:hypothetical protein